MAVAWTDITNGQVAAGAALTTALVTALRDNPEGIAQRASGAPKIFGNAYDYQEFTSSGTWAKPTNAESGDKVIVQVVGGGGAGQRALTPNGGMGGAGAFHTFEDIDDLGSSESVTVGAAGAAGSGNGGNGGDSSFGTSVTSSISSPGVYLEAQGGGGGGTGDENVYTNNGFCRHTRNDTEASGSTVSTDVAFLGGTGSTVVIGGSSVFGGGGGGRARAGNGGAGGQSAYAGRGGNGSDTAGSVANYAINGEFPGGGGGSVDTQLSDDTVGGAGAAGVVRVWCLREEA